MTTPLSREDLSLFVMGEYDGDVAVFAEALEADDNARAMLVDEAELELALRDAAAAATFCPNCDDLIVDAPPAGMSPRCGSCGTATAPGGYTVERVLVANAHGRMYVARDADGTQVALKELAFVQAPSADTIAAFEREARFLRALSHPAIPRYRAAFEEGRGVHTRYYLAQDLVDGTALDTRLDEHFYSEDEIIGVAKQVLEVLAYLQSLSPMVIHRDIKPANMLRRADGSIALVDFGAAHVQGTTAGSTSIGTFGYMPLEQLAGIVDATTDVYALGASLVHLLTRREPWRILALPTLGASNVSPALAAFLGKLVATDPVDRFPSAAAALAGLEHLGKNGVMITGAAARRMREQRRPAVRMAMAALAIPVFIFVLGGVVFGGVQAVRYLLRDDEATRVVPGPPPPAVVVTPVPSVKPAQPLGEECQDPASFDPFSPAPICEGFRPRICQDPASLDRRSTVPACFTGLGEKPERYTESAATQLAQSDAPLDRVLLGIAKDCKLNVAIPNYVRQRIGVKVGAVACGEIFNALLESNGYDYRYLKTLNLAVIGGRSEIEKYNPELAKRMAMRASLGRTDDILPTGGPDVSIGMVDAQVSDVLQLLADAGKVQLIVPDYVKGMRVSVHFAAVPWQWAMTSVLEASGLGLRYRTKSRIVRIAGTHELDKEDQALLEKRAPDPK